MKTVPVLRNDQIQEDRPLPSRNHSRVAHNLSVLLERSKDRFSIHQQLSLNPDGWRNLQNEATGIEIRLAEIFA